MSTCTIHKNQNKRKNLSFNLSGIDQNGGSWNLKFLEFFSFFLEFFSYFYKKEYFILISSFISFEIETFLEFSQTFLEFSHELFV
jgi:hypothetical protein